MMRKTLTFEKVLIISKKGCGSDSQISLRMTHIGFMETLRNTIKTDSHEINFGCWHNLLKLIQQIHYSTSINKKEKKRGR